jgi:PAS domain S-box-containing protein
VSLAADTKRGAPTSPHAGPVADSAFVRLYRKTPIMMHSIDPYGILVEVSDYWLDAMGYERDQVVGRPVTEFLTADSCRRAAVEISIGFKNPESVQHTTREFVTRAGDVIPAEVNISWEIDDGGKPQRSFAVVTDITTRNQYETQLKQFNTELEATNQELERFAFMASHDLQEPLRKIEAVCGIIRQDFGADPDPAIRKFVDNTTRSAARMRILIDDLLKYSRLGSTGVEYRKTDLTDLVQRVVQDCSDQIEQKQAIVTISPLPTLFLDEGFVALLFENLINNALKYSNVTSPEILIDALEGAKSWTLRFSDNGVGIKPKHAEQVFDVFRRLHSSSKYDGTGIGLAICKRVMERHGGDIKVDQAYGPGTRFCIRFLKFPEDKMNMAISPYVPAERRPFLADAP